MDHTLDFIRCAAFGFLFAFKPSEPHLTRYLTEVKGLAAGDVNNRVYPIFTYFSVVVVASFALVQLAGLANLRRFRLCGDRTVIVLGAAMGAVTQWLLVFGTSLMAMQLMQVTYAVGFIAELVFYAYCLKVVPPDKSQRLAAVGQAAVLSSHSVSSVVGDMVLNWTGFGLLGLQWMAASSVTLAFLVACTFRGVDPDMPLAIQRPTVLLRMVYSSRSFWLSSSWWIMTNSVYQILYAYESSLYAEHVKGPDTNGAIFAVSLLAASASSLLLSVKSVEKAATQWPVQLLASLGLVMALFLWLMTQFPSSQWTLGLTFTIVVMGFMFANTFFNGETRRAADGAALQPAAARLLANSFGAQSDAEAIGMRLVSSVYLVNLTISQLTSSLISAITFSWLEVKVDVALSGLAVGLGVLALLVLGVAAMGAAPVRRDGLSTAGRSRGASADGTTELPASLGTTR